MPHFFFHVYDGMSLLDHTGMELPDLDAAQVLAIQYMGEILQNDAMRIRIGQDWRMEVTDEASTALLCLAFSITRSPEAGGIAEAHGAPTSAQARAC